MNAVQCRMARAALGLSTYELAELAGVSRDTVSRIEAGDTTLKAKTVAAIRAALEFCGRRVHERRRAGGAIAEGERETMKPCSVG